MQDDYVPVEGSPGLVRDKATGAIINTDKSGLQAAKARKLAQKQDRDRLNKLENDVSDIKRLLEKLVNDN
jgi:ribosomal protein L13E